MPGKPLLVVAAVRQELAAFRSRCHKAEASGAASSKLLSRSVPPSGGASDSRSHKGDVQFLITGIGRERAYKRASEWLKRNSCRGVVAAGYAGAAQPGLKVGDLLLADEVMEAKSQKVFRPTLQGPSAWLPLSEAPLRGTSPDESFKEAAPLTPPGAWLPARRGRLVTLERVAWTRAAKERLGRRFQALGLDMETAAIAAAAEELGIAWMAIRVVLDPMEENLFSARIFRRMGIASARLAAYLEHVKGEI